MLAIFDVQYTINKIECCCHVTLFAIRSSPINQLAINNYTKFTLHCHLNNAFSCVYHSCMYVWLTASCFGIFVSSLMCVRVCMSAYGYPVFSLVRKIDYTNTNLFKQSSYHHSCCSLIKWRLLAMLTPNNAPCVAMLPL